MKITFIYDSKPRYCVTQDVLIEKRGGWGIPYQPSCQIKKKNIIESWI